MSLLTYEDARPWARSIKNRVSQRQMPPWHVDRTIGIRKFKDDPSLSDAEVATIVGWVDAGAPRGNAADMPAPRVFDDTDRWHIGKPDLIVSLPTENTIEAQSSLIAFEKAYFALAVLFVCSLPLLMLFKNVKPGAGAGGAH